MNAAAEAFSIRHVCGFGDDLPEGMASLDRALEAQSTATRAVTQDGRKAAIISFDVTADGFRPVPRTHLNLIAGGLALSLESDLPQGSTVMSAFAPSSFAGLTSSLVVWLLSGGDAGAASSVRRRRAGAADQRAFLRHADRAGATGAAVGRDRYGLASADRLRNVIGLWRAPEQVASSPAWDRANRPR